MCLQAVMIIHYTVNHMPFIALMNTTSNVIIFEHDRNNGWVDLQLEYITACHYNTVMWLKNENKEVLTFCPWGLLVCPSSTLYFIQIITTNKKVFFLSFPVPIMYVVAVNLAISRVSCARWRHTNLCQQKYRCGVMSATKYLSQIIHFEFWNQEKITWVFIEQTIVLSKLIVP